ESYCLRRPSSKARQSLKLITLIHNLISVKEVKDVDDK
ncbi:unnamed protein product, partial [Rotaria socialis]